MITSDCFLPPHCHQWCVFIKKCSRLSSVCVCVCVRCRAPRENNLGSTSVDFCNFVALFIRQWKRERRQKNTLFIKKRDTTVYRLSPCTVFVSSSYKRGTIFTNTYVLYVVRYTIGTRWLFSSGFLTHLALIWSALRQYVKKYSRVSRGLF